MNKLSLFCVVLISILAIPSIASSATVYRYQGTSSCHPDFLVENVTVATATCTAFESYYFNITCAPNDNSWQAHLGTSCSYMPWTIYGTNEETCVSFALINPVQSARVFCGLPPQQKEELAAGRDVPITTLEWAIIYSAAGVASLFMIVCVCYYFRHRQNMRTEAQSAPTSLISSPSPTDRTSLLPTNFNNSITHYSIVQGSIA